MRHAIRLKIIGVLFLAAALVFPAGVLANDDELEDLEEEMAREMAAFLAETEEERQAFRDERDRDFAEFLQEQWKEFEEFAGLVADRTPKPAKIPTVAKPRDTVPPAGRIIEPPPARPVPPSPSVPEIPPVKPAPAPVPAEAEPAQLPPAPLIPEEPPPAKPTPVPAPAETGPAPVFPEQPTAAPEAEPAPVSPPAPASVPEPEPERQPAAEPVQKPLAGPAVEFDFYGNPVRIPCDPALKARLTGAPGNQTIAAYWKEVGSADFPPTIDQLLLLRDRLRLNDWGYYRLALQTAEALQGAGNDATLFCWFLLCKSGYKAKVGYSGDTVYLLAPTAQLLYGVPYYNLEGIRFYNLSCIEKGEKKPGRLYTYQEDYPGAEQTVRLLLEKTPAIRKDIVSRRLKFGYAGNSHEINVAYNPNAIRFFDSYPQTDLPVFFTAAIESEAEQSLLAALGPIIAGKSETEAVNILLRFVQTAFEYKTDEEQFGREKYLFAEETLFFPFSDCEDRSILFSYLVRRLTGMEVVGLHYPGHIATAVRFSEKVPGDQLEIGGEPYVICDPTFINADIGMAMPQFKGAKPEVIRFGI